MVDAWSVSYEVRDSVISLLLSVIGAVEQCLPPRNYPRRGGSSHANRGRASIGDSCAASMRTIPRKGVNSRHGSFLHSHPGIKRLKGVKLGWISTVSNSTGLRSKTLIRRGHAVPAAVLVTLRV